MTDSIFTEDFKAQPYWWDATPRPAAAAANLPAKADVLIIGSGYTGLCAALETARAGRHTVVIDAQDTGWGCSTRNGGMVSPGIKPGFEALAARHGEAVARAILSEGNAALSWIGEFVGSEGIDCDYVVSGEFFGAFTPRQLDALVADLSRQPPDLAEAWHKVPKSEQHREIDTDAYHGGVVFDSCGSIDPAKYHQGLLTRVIAAEAHVIAHCPAIAIERDGAGFAVRTGKGVVKARDVVIATNGYTGPATPWLRRRVIPIGSYIIATEPLPKPLMDRLLPTARTMSDTRKVVYYYRPSPDRTRIIFGGRVSSRETDPLKSAPLLRRDMIALFPDLADVKISRSWMGFVAYTFDHLAHMDRHDGIHYALGYCGSGIAVASYLGTRIGQQVLGRPEGQTAFDGIGFATRPFYTGNPWFMPAAVAYYRWRDRLAR